MVKPPRSKNFTGIRMNEEICMKNGKIANSFEYTFAAFDE
jgi:hypothetical protein